MFIPPHLPDTQALTDFREHSAEVLKQLAASGRPLLLTQKGRGAGVVMSTETYELLAEAAALVRSIEDVRESIAEFRSGKAIPARAAMDAVASSYRTKAKRKRK